MTDDIRIAALVPCYNEEATIAKVVTDFATAIQCAHIYVYDNNSTDRSVEQAQAAGALVRSEPLQGKGNVIRRMFVDIDADVYVLVHGDHGSRIALSVSKNGSANAPSDADLVDLHSVLFAVRAPGIDSGYEHSFRSIQALFAETILQRSPAREPNDVVLTFLSDLGFEEQVVPWPRVPMPAFAEAGPVWREDSETPALED